MVLVTRMAPRIVLVVPYYPHDAALGLLDTYTGLVIAYISFALPFTIWLLIGFFMDVPLEIEEAAMIDGCSPRRGAPAGGDCRSWRPGSSSPRSSRSWSSWNEFLFALILSGVKAKTLPVVIAGFNTDAARCTAR